MTAKVWIPEDIAEAGKNFLRLHGYQLDIGPDFHLDTLESRIGEYEAVLVRNFPFPRSVIERGRRLRVIARHGIGLDNIDVQAATDHRIQVVYAPESNASSVAEHTLGFIIAVARNFALCDRETRAGNFAIRHRLQAYDLGGKTLGLVGLGRVGTRVARMAKHGLNMEVIALDPYVKPEAKPAEVELVADLNSLLARADFVSLHLPLTEKTRHVMGEPEFGRMKQTAYLLNTARGELVDQGALVSALREGSIAGAALDVLEHEPPDPDNPLFSVPNVLITPHSATITRECMDRMGMHATLGIHEVLSNQEPTWPVNRIP